MSSNVNESVKSQFEIRTDNNHKNAYELDDFEINKHEPSKSNL